MLTVRRAINSTAVEEISRAEIPAILASGKTPIWFDLDAPTQSELEFVEKNLGLHHLTVEDIVKQNQRPKIESFEHYVYVAIHPLIRKDHLEIEPAEVDLLLGPHWLVMVRYGPVPGLVEDSRLHERLGTALARGADFLLYTIADLIVDTFFPIIDHIDDEIEELEEKLVGKRSNLDMGRLLTLKRSLVHIRRAVGPQREIFNQLSRHDSPFIRPDHAIYFRDVYDHLIRIAEELDSLRDILSGAMEVHLSSISNQLNQTMKRLTSWGIIFVVITAIAGIYGMNFEYMPELKWRYGYPVAILLMIGISAGLYVYFKKNDYF
ncbi:MAG: magnesium/cobalt transporter CorA [Deltaproteobacteria bacterium]|nr:magnesium/cobalt transporter CorA [Deltaproteobacteria bacterium]